MSTGSRTGPIPRARTTAALQRLQGCTRQAEALDAVGEILSQLVGCEEFALLAWEPAAGGFSLIAAMGVHPERLQPLLAPGAIPEHVAHQRVAYLPGRSALLGASAHEAGLTACVPIMSGEWAAGVLVLFRLLPQKRQLDEEDLELLGLLSTQGALALKGARPRALVLPPLEAPAPSAETARGLRTVYLHPGELFTATEPTEVTTILGSCVSVCLWDTRLRIGGINHFLLPTPPGGHVPSIRYGDSAVPALLEELARLGSVRRHLQAKVFGGSTSGGFLQPATGSSLGQRNAELARKLLAEAGIAILAEDLGGPYGRKVRFRTDDGMALVKLLKRG
jgi:chemotaxis protein CheD